MDFEGPWTTDSAKWTLYEREAVRLMERRQPSKRPGGWVPVRNPLPGVWYDWADPFSGKVGQCRRGAEGWTQGPRGLRPVVLAWAGDRGCRIAGMDGAGGDIDERRVRVEE
jgi:hypothetical protein